ncbi:MAG: SDR family oxidoreductase [Burkholderiales bacterium]|nr:SDR family oxidoreductase [Burkholderiales bacterium]
MNIVITGSNSGFGRLTALTLAKAGHTVFATMRDASGRNAAAAADLRAIAGIQVVELDVTDEASVVGAIDTIARQTDGAIDGVVNNAGRFSMGIQEAFSVDDVKLLFDTNVFGPLRVNRAVLPYMRVRRSGLIVYLSSVLGRFSLPTMGTYSASKYAIEALAEAQHDELRGLGIDVVLVEPGAFPTNVGNNGQYAGDTSRTPDYGSVADIPEKVGADLGALFASAQAPNPQDVADAMLRLVGTPAGQRPDRVVVDRLTGAPVDALNQAYAGFRQQITRAFGLA